MAKRVVVVAFLVYAAVAVATGRYLNERDSEPRLGAARLAAGGDLTWLLHPWHKPVLTTLAAGVIALGGGVVGVKVVQGALAAAALGLAAAAAARWGARRSSVLLAVVLAGLGPFWLRGVVSALTETSCAFFLALALWLWSEDRPLLSALAISCSFLARFDGLLFAMAWAPFLVQRRRWLGVLLLGAAPLAWNLAGWATTGDPGFLLTHEPHPVTGSPYGHGSFLDVPALLPVTLGFVLLPALLGVRRAPRIALAAAGVAILGHTILWGFGLMGSLGMPRYLVTIAPAALVVAAFGVDRLARSLRVATVALALLAGLATLAYREIEWRGAVRLATWPQALTEDPLVARLNGGGPRLSTWRDAKPGAYVLWESVWTAPEVFEAIPATRLELVATLEEPARWPWEKDWTGRVYRLR